MANDLILEIGTEELPPTCTRRGLDDFRRNLEARLGFYYEPTPVTNQFTSVYATGNDRMVPSVGLGYAVNLPWNLLANPLQIDAFFQYHFLMKKDFQRVQEFNNRFFRNQDLEAGGYVLNYGVSLTFHF